MKLRKLSAAALALSMLSATTAIVASAAQTIEADGLKFEVLEDGTLSLKGFANSNDKKTVTELEIPAEVDGQSVTSIGFAAFSSCSNLKSITIPDSVTSIDDSAFRFCESLTSVTIPDSVTSIGNGAFDDTPWLKSKKEENPLVVIGKVVYDGKNCTGDVVIPEGVTSICESAFAECTSLESITIPDSVTSIGYGAFVLCSSLESVVIPEGVTMIDGNTFMSCSSLKSVTLPKGLTSIGGYAFQNCSKLESINIPDSVTYIGGFAFGGCSSLESSIVIPDGVTSIESVTFLGCSSLKSVTLPKGLTEIGDSAFSGCSSLESITIPDGVITIYNGAFSYCESLKSAIIPESVTDIALDVFKNCTNLTDVYYAGSKEQWKEVRYYIDFTAITGTFADETVQDDIGVYYEGKSPLEVFLGNAEIHYNSTGPEIPDDSSDSEGTEDSETSGDSSSSTETKTEEFKSGDVEAKADEGVVPEGAELSAELKKSENNEFTYDIKFVKDSKEVKPDGKVTVSLPLPDALKDKTVYVYYLEDGKIKEDMNAEVKDGKVVFTTTHFSEYLLTGEEKEIETTVPDTGFGGFAILGVVALAGAAVVVSRKRK